MKGCDRPLDGGMFSDSNLRLHGSRSWKFSCSDCGNLEHESQSTSSILLFEKATPRSSGRRVDAPSRRTARWSLTPSFFCQVSFVEIRGHHFSYPFYICTLLSVACFPSSCSIVFTPSPLVRMFRSIGTKHSDVSTTSFLPTINRS